MEKPDWKERYARQLILPEIGEAGQEKLRKAKVLIVGAGGLGSPIALYLCGAGVGTLGIIDDDTVSISNLQRQILYTEAEQGLPKSQCAVQRLRQLNSETGLHHYPFRLTADNAEEMIRQYDIVVDGCDNYTTRYIINDVCEKLQKPYIYGAISGFSGQVSVFHYQGGPSYRDLYPDEKELSQISPFKGVIGITPGITGSIQALEVIKIITGCGEVLSGKLWTINLLTLENHIILL
ncbi:MAG: HesA/MoeB/ThiF family protein [Bacteroides sp.]|nr:HesA/MoeB/ThiF family protein [Bacteroides sp.]